MVFAASRLAQSLTRLHDAAAVAQTAMTDGDFTAADSALADAEDAIADAQNGLALVTFLRIVPWVGTQIVGLGYTLDAGSATISALREAIAITARIAR